MKFFFFVVYISIFSSFFSQSYLFKSLSVAEGLAQTQINDICEDENGYLWIATLGGLSRYNGNSFYNYSIEDGLANNRVTALFSENNKLWIAQESAVSKLENGKIVTWKLQQKNVIITDIIKFNNTIVFSTFGHGIFYFEKNKIKNFKFSVDDQNKIRQLNVLDNRLYIATRKGLFTTNDFKFYKEVRTFKDLNITCFALYKNQILLSDVEGDLYLSPVNSNKKTLFYDNPYQSFNLSILINKKDIFISSDSGILWFNDGRFAQLISQTNGLPINNVQCGFVDSNQTLWFGSLGKGLLKFSGTKVQYYQQKDGMESDLVTSVHYLNGTHFIGTFDGGLYAFKNNHFSKKDLPNTIIWSMIYDFQKQLWIATQNGLYVWNEKIINSYLKNEKIACLYKDSRIILAGGNKGLYRIKEGKLDTLCLFDSPIGTIRSIEKVSHKILLGTDDGVYEYKDKKLYKYLTLNKRVIALKHNQNRLWIGTEEGLFAYENGIIKKEELSNESSSQFINFIVDKNKETLFVGTNNGVYKIQNNVIQHFGLDEGLISLETNINSGFIDFENQLWFGTSDGLMRMQQEVLNSETNPYIYLKIKELKINFSTISKKYFKKNKKYDVVLDLPHNKNNLFVEIEGICLKKNNELRYEYLLEGMNASWSPEISNPILQFSNLSAGTYLLRIRAKNGKNHYSNEIKIKLTIQQVFYKTWWFFLFCLFFIFGIIYFYFKYRIEAEKNKQYRESLEMKNKLLALEQESLNASMNRHFIFNSLNSIQFFINTQDKISANKFLSNFAKLIRKNLDSSIDNNGLVQLSEEIERLELYLSLESMRFKDRFDYTIQIDEQIDLENIEVPSMLLQPFVENSIIHGILPLENKKGKIEIVVLHKCNGIEIHIKDNGVGVEESLAKKSNILGDHKSKGVEINIKRIALLNLKQRVQYLIEGPRQIKNENYEIIGTEVIVKWQENDSKMDENDKN